MFSTLVPLTRQLSDWMCGEMLLLRQSESLWAELSCPPAIPGSLRREARQRGLPGQDTCEGAVAVKIIHPAPHTEWVLPAWPHRALQQQQPGGGRRDLLRHINMLEELFSLQASPTHRQQHYYHHQHQHQLYYHTPARDSPPQTTTFWCHYFYWRWYSNTTIAWLVFLCVKECSRQAS